MRLASEDELRLHRALLKVCWRLNIETDGVLMALELSPAFLKALPFFFSLLELSEQLFVSLLHYLTSHMIFSTRLVLDDLSQVASWAAGSSLGPSIEPVESLADLTLGTRVTAFAVIISE